MEQRPFDGNRPAETGETPRKQAGLSGVWAGLLYIGIYLGLQMAASVAGTLVVWIREVRQNGLTDVGGQIARAMETLAGGAGLLSGIVDVLFAALLLLIFRLRKKSPAEELCLRPVPFSRLAPLIPLGLCLNALLSCLLLLLPAELLNNYNESAEALMGSGNLLLMAVLAVFIAPLAEEVLFRGLVYTRFSRSMPRWLAALLSSALFGLMHGHPVWMGYTFVVALLLCLTFDWYGSLLAPLVLHLCFNLGSFLSGAVAELPVSGVLLVSAPLTGLLLALAYQRGVSGRGG